MLVSLSLTAACGHPKTTPHADAGPPSSFTQNEVEITDVQAPLRSVRVALDGTYSDFSSPSFAGSSRIYPRAFKTWVFSEPRPDAQKLGYLRLGSSAAVRPGIVGKSGCARGWYALLPKGFVCLDEAATLDANDPLVVAMVGATPNLEKKMPYLYGTVRRPGPVYRRVPTANEAQVEEPDLTQRYQRWLSAQGETGASYGQQIWITNEVAAPDLAEAWRTKYSDPLPDFLRNGKSPPKIPGESSASASELVLATMAPRVGYSLFKTFLSDGRRYGLTTRLEVVPTDRLRPIQGSEFHGFRIPQDIDFPFAIVRQPGARLYRNVPGTRQLKPSEHAQYRSALKLTGKQAFFHGKLHYETETGAWVSDRDASRLDPARKMPAWGTNGEKWIDVNVTKQTLALYEGTRAVYATLVSTGEAGLSDPEQSTATKRGIYRIHTKHISATMDSDVVGEEFELRDVPYVQYFEANYALHGAYWHDRFGIPKSHGCINMAPEDARRIFFWTEPSVPDGWHGALLPLKGTVVFVHP